MTASDRPLSFPAVRRVVTGHDAAGRAVVVMDGEAPNQRRPDAFTMSTAMWISEGAPADFLAEGDGSAIEAGFAPPAGGSRFGILDIAPGNTRFMHRTDTLDYVICLSGAVDLELDDETVNLRAGDVVIQRGTSHAWLNRGTEPARIAFILLDGTPKREGSL